MVQETDGWKNVLQRRCSFQYSEILTGSNPKLQERTQVKQCVKTLAYYEVEWLTLLR